MFTTRLPTGSRENFRGLGITRVLGQGIVSWGKGKVRPHGNLGFEWWNKGLTTITDPSGSRSVTARHQIQYAAGLEIEAGAKVTVLFDMVGRHTRGDGSIATQSYAVPPDLAAETVTAIDARRRDRKRAFARFRSCRASSGMSKGRS